MRYKIAALLAKMVGIRFIVGEMICNKGKCCIGSVYETGTAIMTSPDASFRSTVLCVDAACKQTDMQKFV